MYNLDSINETIKECGCVIMSNLDIIENKISESTIKICKKHYLANCNKMKFTFNKSQNIYIANSEIISNSIKNKFKKISSDIDLKYNEDKYHILQFGKYKHKSFKYVYNNDKIYCYNLSFWKYNKVEDFKNKEVSKFVDYIKEEIRLL